MDKSSFFVLDGVTMIRSCGAQGDEKRSRLRLSNY
jgi:hypothetical protein